MQARNCDSRQSHGFDHPITTSYRCHDRGELREQSPAIRSRIRAAPRRVLTLPTGKAHCKNPAACDKRLAVRLARKSTPNGGVPMSTPSPGDDGGTATTVVYFGRDELVIPAALRRRQHSRRPVDRHLVRHRQRALLLRLTGLHRNLAVPARQRTVAHSPYHPAYPPGAPAAASPTPPGTADAAHDFKPADHARPLQRTPGPRCSAKAIRRRGRAGSRSSPRRWKSH